MGVNHLWSIIQPHGQRRNLTSLSGHTIAIDLSIWICESQGVKQLNQTSLKPHLRNLFFRVCHLCQIGVKVVFVVDGQPPEIKWTTIVNRLQQEKGEKKRIDDGKSRKMKSRSRLKSMLRECCELLDLMGIPYVQAAGEAEAMCASLNVSGMVDACVTNDGDAFLYGAKTVFRNFTMDSSDPHIDYYDVDNIRSCTGLSRSAFIAMAVLLGCDYIPAGVPGVGKAAFVKLLQSFDEPDLLDRISIWPSLKEDEVKSYESSIWLKAMSTIGFPFNNVIQEFLRRGDNLPEHLPSYKRPDIFSMQEYMLSKLNWPKEYTSGKVVPMVTLYDLRMIQKLGPENFNPFFLPFRIIKSRKRKGEDCLEVEWCLVEKEKNFENQVTLEEFSLFSCCYPHLVSTWQEERRKTKDNKGKRMKSKADTKTVKGENTIVDLFSRMAIDSQSNSCQKSSNIAKCIDHKISETVDWSTKSVVPVSSNSLPDIRATDSDLRKRLLLKKFLMEQNDKNFTQNEIKPETSCTKNLSNENSQLIIDIDKNTEQSLVRNEDVKEQVLNADDLIYTSQDQTNSCTNHVDSSVSNLDSTKENSIIVNCEESENYGNFEVNYSINSSLVFDCNRDWTTDICNCEPETCRSGFIKSTNYERINESCTNRLKTAESSLATVGLCKGSISKVHDAKAFSEEGILCVYNNSHTADEQLCNSGRNYSNMTDTVENSNTLTFEQCHKCSESDNKSHWVTNSKAIMSEFHWIMNNRTTHCPSRYLLSDSSVTIDITDASNTNASIVEVLDSSVDLFL